MRTSSTAPVVALLTLVLSVSLAACSDDDADGPDGSGPSGSAAAEPVVTVTTVGKVAGRLDDARRQELKTQVRDVVDNFLDEAYLGEFPRNTFGPAYRDFTSGAARQAKRDGALLNNRAIAKQIDTAVATERRLMLDVFAPKGRPEGVTARFVLEYDTAGSLERTERVKGNLVMIRKGSTWRIFGYDVIRNVVA